MQHTPGPWERDPKHDLAIMAPDGNDYPWHIANVMPDAGDMDGDANARLIAAAPDLLAALESLFAECAMVHRFGGDADNTQAANAAVDNARAAIAKATGGASHDSGGKWDSDDGH